MSLYRQAANKLNEVNGVDELDAQETDYSEDELLEALDLLEPPENFHDHQWQVYKSHLRKPIAKVLIFSTLDVYIHLIPSKPTICC